MEQTLQKLGLDPHEVKTYLTLLDLGESTATKLSERSGLGRVHTYQIINRLIEKGLASYVIKNNTKHFSAADPETLLKDLEEKRDNLKKILPALKARQKRIDPETKVEIYRGRKGVTTVLKIILKDKKNYHLIGGGKEACTLFELENKVFIMQAEKTKMKGYLLARKDDHFFIGKNETYRFVPDNMLSSTTQMLWGDKTAIYVWSKPYYVILIDNKEITQSNLSTFKHLWNIGKKPTEKDRKKRLVKY